MKSINFGDGNPSMSQQYGRSGFNPFADMFKQAYIDPAGIKSPFALFSLMGMGNMFQRNGRGGGQLLGNPMNSRAGFPFQFYNPTIGRR